MKTHEIFVLWSWDGNGLTLAHGASRHLPSIRLGWSSLILESSPTCCNAAASAVRPSPPSKLQSCWNDSEREKDQSYTSHSRLGLIRCLTFARKPASTLRLCGTLQSSTVNAVHDAPKRECWTCRHRCAILIARQAIQQAIARRACGHYFS